MMDLLYEQENQEARWAQEVQETRRKFEARVHEAMGFARNKANRMKHYTKLRQEIGDDAAREVAKMCEGILKGTGRYPRWFQSMRSNRG